MDRFPRLLLLSIGGALALTASGLADDKDLLKKGLAPPNVMVIISNASAMKYMPYVQGQTPSLPPDGQYQDSPVSKFGLMKGVLRQVVQQNSWRFNFGLSWYSYHQESVAHKYWSYQLTSNVTIPGATFDFPNDGFQEAMGTYEEWGTLGNGPIASTSGSSEVFGIAGVTLAGPWFGDVAAAGICATSSCPGFAFEKIDATHRVAVHLQPLVGQPYGQLSVSVVKTYQVGTVIGGTTTWTTQASTPAGNPGTVSLLYSASVSQNPAFPNTFTTGPDSSLYMGFMRAGDWSLNSDCGGWFVQNSLPAIGIPRDYSSDLACSMTLCLAPPESSVGCVLRYTRPQASVISYIPGAGTYVPLNPPDDVPGNCSPSVVHTGPGPEDQIIQLSTGGNSDNHIPEDKMFANADSYFSSKDCFVNGVRSDDPSKGCRTGAIILLSDTFLACGPNCSANATAKYLISLKSHHVPVYVISFGVADGTAQASEAHCIAQTSGSENATNQGVFFVNATTPAGAAQQLSDAFAAIFSKIDEETGDFASSTISSVQAGSSQLAFLETFNARKSRSVWDGALRAYKLLNNGAINPAPVSPDVHAQNPDGTDCVTTVRDPNDPFNNLLLDAVCNQFPTLQWNAQNNLAAVPVSAGNPSGVADLAAGALLTQGSTYVDTTNDSPHTIPVNWYPGRRIIWSLPSTVAGSAALPPTLPVNGSTVARAEPVPEISEPFLVAPSSSYWPTLKLLLTAQTSPPASGAGLCGASPCIVSDSDAGQTVRFVRGDRDSVIKEVRAAQGLQPFPAGDAHYYASPSGPLKFGDIFHSNPQLLGGPANPLYFNSNVHGYQSFFNSYRNRRRILFAGANDGLLHAFDVGVWDRNTSVCTGSLTDCYDLGTGAEVFAYAPRSVMQNFKRAKDANGAQGKRDEWTVDGAPSAADMFIDVNHSGTPVAGNRAWHTVLVGTTREGSAFEGQTSCPPAGTTAFQNSASSVYALDVTRPEPLDGNSNETAGSFASPGCLDGGTGCSGTWPKVIWEIQDTTDADGNGYPDMGESWSKPGLGRICLARDNAGDCTDERFIALFGGGFDRERKNRRGNWFYIVDVETGFVLFKANSGKGNISGSATFAFGSVAGEPSAIDVNGDGFLDFVYFGDLLGQLWKLDLRDVSLPSGAPTDRWSSKLRTGTGSALLATLVFQAPQPVNGSTQYFPIYYRPTVVSLGQSVSGQPILGVSFGTGDRDDILATCDGSTVSTAYNQRYYYVVDKSNSTTITESTAGMLKIASSSAANVATAPSTGWYIMLGTSAATAGERIITNSLAVDKYIYFFTFTPPLRGAATNCPPPSKCTAAGGLTREYVVFFGTGNYAPGQTDRGVNIANAYFATDPIFYVSGDQSGNVAYMTNYGVFQPAKTRQPTKAMLKDWKER